MACAPAGLELSLWSSAMHRRLCLPLLLLMALGATPATAKVLAEGKPAKGFYWQKMEQKGGKIVYQCRASGDSKFQKSERCTSAGAVKPK
jgi:hypothetical protein